MVPRATLLHYNHRPSGIAAFNRISAVSETDEGGSVASIVAKLRALEQHHVAISSEVEMLQPVPRLPHQVVRSSSHAGRC